MDKGSYHHQPPKQFEWLLFDADGTLFDYEQAEEKALEGTFHELVLPFSPSHARAYGDINRQIWLDFENGQITSQALRIVRFQRLFEALHLDADAQAFSDRYLQNLANASDLMNGAADLIHTLRSRYHLALITNGLKDVQRPRLARSPIANDFEAVAISEEMGVAKPDPRYFERLFARIGHPDKTRVLVIGDSLTSDIQGGINYGLDTCWYNPSRRMGDVHIQATYEIYRLDELPGLLRQQDI